MHGQIQYIIVINDGKTNVSARYLMLLDYHGSGQLIGVLTLSAF
jgi:hypothetical protein